MIKITNNKKLLRLILKVFKITTQDNKEIKKNK